jgi:hypothetical protein
MSGPDGDRTPGNASRMPEDRLAHESRLEDQRPRGKRTVTALLFVSGFAVGALLLVLVAWVASSMTDSDASLVVYLVPRSSAGHRGALLRLSLARADGDDAAIVRPRPRWPRGRADRRRGGSRRAAPGSRPTVRQARPFQRGAGTSCQSCRSRRKVSRCSIAPTIRSTAAARTSTCPGRCASRPLIDTTTMAGITHVRRMADT